MKLSLHHIKSRSTSMVWVLTAMLLLFPIGLPALPGVILCLESDGRIEIESDCGADYLSSFSMVSNDADNGSRDPEATNYSDSDLLTSCVGVLFFSSPVDGQAPLMVRTANQAKKLPIVSPILLPSVDRGDVLFGTPNRFKLSSGGHTPVTDLAPLRSVVLLV